MDFLNRTTAEARKYFWPRFETGGLLAADEIQEFWKLYQTLQLRIYRPEARSIGSNRATVPYGLYFIFYQHDEALVPAYVGKGALPGRVLVHFGSDQFVRQVLTYQFGGIHSEPWLLPEDRKARLRQGLEPLRLGFVFCCAKDQQEIREKVARYEKDFQDALKPVLDGKHYNEFIKQLQGSRRFDLKELSTAWVALAKSSPWSAMQINQSIQDCQKRHDEFLGTHSGGVRQEGK